MRATACGILILAGLATGCAAGRRAPAQSARPADEATFVEQTFGGGRRILAGFDPPTSQPAWHVGDQALFGVLLEEDGQRQVRFVRATVKTPVLAPDTKVIVVPPDEPAPRSEDDVQPVTHATVGQAAHRTYPAAEWRMVYTLTPRTGPKRRLEFTSRRVCVAVDVYDENAALIDTSFLMLPEAMLRAGLYDVTAGRIALRRQLGDEFERSVRERPEDFPHELDDCVHLLNTLMALSNILWECPSLTPILKAVRPTPNLLSIIMHFGLHFTLQTEAADLGEVPPSLPGWVNAQVLLRLPLVVYLNDEAILRCDLLVAEPRPPLQLGAGIVALDIGKLQGSPTSVHVRLLAARRGAP